jgi:ATP-binding cassette subfamily C (CFTR/MRP) protein 1
MTSLLVKAIIQFSTQHANAQRNGTDAPSVGRGVGMCIGLFCLLMLATLCVNHFFMRSAGTGVLARAALISALYERESMLQDAGTSARFQMKLTGRVLRVLECAGAINLTNRSRIQHPNGKLVNHISTDISRIDFAAGMFHMVWTAPSRSSKSGKLPSAHVLISRLSQSNSSLLLSSCSFRSRQARSLVLVRTARSNPVM